MSAEVFHDPDWQLANLITDSRQVRELLAYQASEAFLDELEQLLCMCPRALRLTPYQFSLINWSEPWGDPIRKQYIPLACEIEPDHPLLQLAGGSTTDRTLPLGVTNHEPRHARIHVPELGLLNGPLSLRAHDRQQQRSLNGIDTQGDVDHVWRDAMHWLHRAVHVENVTLHGADIFVMEAETLSRRLKELLAVPHLRRLLIETEGLGALPQRILRDGDWLDALAAISREARQRGIEFRLQASIHHPAEITLVTQKAMDVLFLQGVRVSNRTLLMRGVNDDEATMRKLVEQLTWIHMRPTTIECLPMLRGGELHRTSLRRAIELEEALRHTRGLAQQPRFVVPTSHGGQLRSLGGSEAYCDQRGVAVFRPMRGEGEELTFVFDPLKVLEAPMRRGMLHPVHRKQAVQKVLDMAGIVVAH